MNLRHFDHLEWVTTEEDLWAIPEHLHKIPHAPVLRAGMERTLARVDRRLFAAGCYGTLGLPAQVRRRLKLRTGPGA